MRQPANWYAVERFAIRTARQKTVEIAVIVIHASMFGAAAVQVVRLKPAWQRLFNIAFSSVYLGEPHFPSQCWPVLNRSGDVRSSVSTVSVTQPDPQECCMEPQWRSRCCWAAHLLRCRMQLPAHPPGDNAALHPKV